METNTILILIAVIVVGGIICLWLYYVWKHRKIKKNVPKDLIKCFEECERRLKYNQEHGIKESGEQVINKVIRERRESVKRGTVTAMGGTDIKREQTIKNTNIPEQSEERRDIQDRTANNIVKHFSGPVEIRRDYPQGNKRHRRFTPI